MSDFTTTPETEEKSERPLIFMVEDDLVLAGLTADYLEKFGFRVLVEADGNRAVQRILEEKPGLVVLDVMLPGKDGVDICRELRSHSSVPILFLTARTEQIDQVLGLEIGADDYVCKPAEPRLLLARVKALMRRTKAEVAPRLQESGSGEGHSISFGWIEIDNRSRSVRLHGEPMEFSHPEYEVLWVLASHAGTILSRNAIFNQVRGIDYDGSNRFVDATISQIRFKIGDDANRPSRIKTVRGKGYLFVPNIDELP